MSEKKVQVHGGWGDNSPIRPASRYRVHRSRMRTHMMQDVQAGPRSYSTHSLCGNLRYLVISTFPFEVTDPERTERVDCPRCLAMAEKKGLI